MAWVKIDDRFDDHPKWADAPGDSIALWLAAMAWCNRNDSIEGFIPTRKLHGLVNVRNVNRSIADLVTREAFHTADGGYLIHDYPEYQQPEKVREISAKRAAAGKLGAAARWAKKAQGTASVMANEMASAIANGCPDSRDPSPTASTQETDDGEHPAESSSSVDIAFTVAARAVYLKDPSRCRDGNPDRYIAGIERTMRAERRLEVQRLTRSGADPIDIAGVLVTSDPAARQAANELGLLDDWTPPARRDGPVELCPDCLNCRGTGFIDVGDPMDRTSAPCPNRPDQRKAAP